MFMNFFKKAKNKVIAAAQSFNKNSWLQISQWLVIFKVFILIGVTIFTIGQFSGVSDTDLAAYIWFAFALIITWVLSLKMVANNNNSEILDTLPSINLLH